MDSAVLLAGFLAAALRFTTPVLFAALGETISQRAGVFNVGLEGIMLVSAFVAVLASVWTGSPYGGLLAAILAGMAMGALHAFFSITLKVDQIFSGLALIALGTGLSGYGYRVTIGAETPAEIAVSILGQVIGSIKAAAAPVETEPATRPTETS